MKSDKKIYLDYNATTPADPRVVDELLPYFTQKFGNSSSSGHVFGWEADEAVERAREQVADLIGVSAGEIYFTSGATEAINITMKGLAQANRDKGDHIITCTTEHKAVLDTCKSLENSGYSITYLPVDESGAIELQDLKNALTDQTILVCLMHANNETGTLHPIKEISRITQSYGIALMSDATQTVGKIQVSARELGADILTFSSHKLYGPKGAGALYISKDNKPKIDPVLTGGGQEKGLRPGTLNVPAIVGFGKACEICAHEMASDTERLTTLRSRLESELKQIHGVSINGDQANRLPYMTNISFHNIDSSHLLLRLKNLAVSQGSACSSSMHQPSHVLKAMGLSDELAFSSIRIGLGRFTTQKEVATAIREIKAVLPELRLVAG
jgi:cysteine desulfurase